MVTSNVTVNFILGVEDDKVGSAYILYYIFLTIVTFSLQLFVYLYLLC